MEHNQNKEPVAGWVGGFAESNPSFAYPEPNLSSLPLLDNMANINLLERQQKVEWPEFSWETKIGDPESRCFQMFAPDISRLGYTSKGRIYSIICPQQGAFSKFLGSLNIEITVTGQRGWVNEPKQLFAADMTVEAKIWFGPNHNPFVKYWWEKFEKSHFFPLSKEKAIQITTHKAGSTKIPFFPVRSGQSTGFPIPEFAQHGKPDGQGGIKGDAWAVGNLAVGIGSIIKTGHTDVDNFNKAVVAIFNFVKGNILKEGNVLNWNVWFTSPTLVDKKEWKGHADKWRESIQADHGSPEGEGTSAKYFDGRPFSPLRLRKSETSGVDKINTGFLGKYETIPEVDLEAEERRILEKYIKEYEK
jgi:hypothetical protein